MAGIKKPIVPRAPRGLEYELAPHILHTHEISEKLQEFMDLAADIDPNIEMTGPELLKKYAEIDEAMINSYKVTLFDEAMNRLIDAESKILELEALVYALTQPKGRGHRRTHRPSMASAIQSLVSTSLVLAKFDGKKLSLTEAVKQALRDIHAYDSNGKPLPSNQLEALVNSRHPSALRTYRRRKSKSTDK